MSHYGRALPRGALTSPVTLLTAIHQFSSQPMRWAQLPLPSPSTKPGFMLLLYCSEFQGQGQEQDCDGRGKPLSQKHDRLW